MKQRCLGFLTDESGISAIEFGLVAAIVSVAIILNLQSIAAALNSIFDSVASNFGN